MEKFKLRRLAGFLILSIFMFSCSNELHMTLPNGPQGLSAYDLWVEQVNNGSIKWDKNNVDINNFFLYLKGADGKDGQNGVDGKSAYQLWIEQVKSGIDNPHNTGTNWSVDNISMQDFWYFLTGAKGQNGSTPIIGSNGNWFIDGTDTGLPSRGNNGESGEDGSVVTIGDNGNWYIDSVDTTVPAFGKNGNNGTNGSNGKSAYELWVEEVAKGLDDPHNPGTEWDKSKTTTNDFWEYLRGADGNDGKDGADGSPGEIGEAGKDVIIVKGKPNVVAQYAAQEFSEYVRWTDGGVLYTVYDDNGSVSPGAKVKGLPGILDPTKVYTADANGQFLVPKEDLPLDKVIADRFGTTAEVEYSKSTGVTVKEVSAPNTYVPSRMQMRLTLGSNIKLEVSSNGYPCLHMYPIIERKIDKDAAWSSIPSYLGNLSQYLRAYKLTDMNDPYSSSDNRVYSMSWNISSKNTYGLLQRYTKKSEYQSENISVSYTWDGSDIYFNWVLESYYGEKPNANIVVKMAPIQYMPIIKNVRAYNYDEKLNIFSRIEGEFDFGVNNSNIDQSLLFKINFKKETKTSSLGTNFDYYSPELTTITDIQDNTGFEISFDVKANTADNSKSLATIANPAFTVSIPYANSRVGLETKNDIGNYFRTVGTLGTLERDSVTLKFKIKGIQGSFSSIFSFPDIPVQEITE